MISFGAFYLLGATFGEVVLLALWYRAQPPAATLPGYWSARRGDVILSGALAAITCVAWSEGTLSKFVIDHLSLDLEKTLGFSVIAGAIVSIFAHQILSLVGKLPMFKGEGK